MLEDKKNEKFFIGSVTKIFSFIFVYYGHLYCKTYVLILESLF